MDRLWTLEEARAELPRLLAVAEEVIAVRVALVDPVAALADRKAAEARLSELLDSLTSAGIQVKGWAPLLVDFPAELNGGEVLLCWLEGETALGWFHDRAQGFAGRRRLP
jgi:hypothetical protein